MVLFILKNFFNIWLACIPTSMLLLQNLLYFIYFQSFPLWMLNLKDLINFAIKTCANEGNFALLIFLPFPKFFLQGKIPTCSLMCNPNLFLLFQNSWQVDLNEGLNCEVSLSFNNSWQICTLPFFDCVDRTLMGNWLIQYFGRFHLINFLCLPLSVLLRNNDLFDFAIPLYIIFLDHKSEISHVLLFLYLPFK
jgi:hypothetical protein